MNILYFGKICDDELFVQKEKQQQPYFVAQYMYEKALYNELKKSEQLRIECISIYQTEYFPKNKLFFNRSRKNSDGFKYLKFINLPYLRELSYFISSCLYIVLWFIKHRKNKNEKKFIYTSCHFPPVSLAIVIMSKFLSIKKIVTFTDLASFTYSKEKVIKMRFFKRILMRPYISLVNWLQKSYDAYIIFSEKMNAVVNDKKKPFIVIEGIFNNSSIDYNSNFIKRKAIAHAGTLNKEVGIGTILKVFRKINDDDIELWLIGKGDMTEEILKQSKIDPRIKYFGFLPRTEVFKKLKQASILVNLRNPNDEYTNYSFPSKMFEYMISGTPVLTTKLGGIPNEYLSYLYTIEKFDLEIMVNTLEDLVKKNEEELNSKGMKAKKYILENKNSAAQSKKIINFLKQLV